MAYNDNSNYPQRPPLPDANSSNPSVSFQDAPVPQRGGQNVPPLPPKQSSKPNFTSKPSNSGSGYSGYEPELTYTGAEAAPHTSFSEAASHATPFASAAQQGGDFKRKKSLVRPDRERMDPNHRLYHYREHAAAMVEEGQGQGGSKQRGAPPGVMPSTTGNAPVGTGAPQLRRGKSLLAREPTETSAESGLNIFKRGATLRRKNTKSASNPGPPNAATTGTGRPAHSRNDMDRAWGPWACLGNFAPGPKDGWMVYCYLLTICFPGFVLGGVFGITTPEAQRAWREKIGLCSIIAYLMAAVAFLTFGFTRTVCNNSGNRIKAGHVDSGSLVINGYDYSFATWNHPEVAGYFNGSTNPLYDTVGWDAGGMDASFMFQTVNKHCLNVITPAADTAITNDGTNMDWYFPCNLHNQNGTSAVNMTGYGSDTNCHLSDTARTDLSSSKIYGQVYYTWGQVKNTTRNLAVFEQSVLDLDLLQWLDGSEVSYPAFFDTVKNGNETYTGKDITMLMYRAGMKNVGKCMQDVIRIGFIDTKSIGCVASDVVLYVSLVFILGVVSIKFGLAVTFAWFFSWKLGNFKGESYQQRMARAAEIENWTDDIYRPAPSRYRPSVNPKANQSGRKTVFLPSTSRFSKAEPMMVNSRPGTSYGNLSDVAAGGGGYRSRQTSSTYGNKLLQVTPPGSPALKSSRSSTSLPMQYNRDDSRQSFAETTQSDCPFILQNVIPQPPLDYEPFNFPLAHTICLVTAYSESIEGLRTTLDSLATTDYPNSHKVILVIADGMVKGSGSKLKTPDIVLGMMKDLIVPEHEVEAHSYVAIADGHKRHNMAKVYAGFYDYDDATVEGSKQQKVPIILVAKVGNPLEAHDAKPGNRGKRDSQIVLMGFLQKVMFDERMTTFEYEFFNSLWRITGISPDRYETVLCVDADTKVFPDAVTRMVACMVHDPEIMGLCGETKIANKSETWVTMIQVFEYYISHHQSKAFETMFGGVTCLPGCFSMYRIKAPKGDSGYWVPILANPDIVEHYSENIVDTLHKKNLLLLGEDRFLTTMMLKTFPKRKMVFAPQAVCKTVVPDTFRILLSQRRRWINSTIHNLFELVLVRDLCGTFCFSMQFVVGMELVGTMVLPAAICFTLYIIIIAIIPSETTPTLSLILLALILGLPGLLIVITSRKVAYIGWMLIYLCSLPVWNLVLPAYAFWHMDDFSWGATRKVEGEGKENHGDKEGLFDSSHIVMKRWAEFERERRWKSGTQSRSDSYYDVVHQRSASPKSAMTRDRYSVGSTNETSYTGGGSDNTAYYRPSQSYASMDTSQPLLEPPNRGAFRGPREGSPGSSDSQDHGDDPRAGWDRSPSGLSAYSPQPTYQNISEEEPILDAVQRRGFAPQDSYRSSESQEDYNRRAPQQTSSARQPIVSSGAQRHHLTDAGPAQGAEPVRRVPRSASKRASFSSSAGGHGGSSQQHSRMGSAASPSGGLPPGAAPPQSGRYY